MKQTLGKEKTAYIITCIGIEILCVWIAYHTPYGVDDWAWGLDYGMRMFLTGELNSRYVGNLFEIIITRSYFLKTILHGTLGALLPVTCARVIEKLVDENENDSRQLDLLFLAEILFLTIPIAVWKETWGWVAGFSNYGLAVFLLICWQALLQNAVQKREQKTAIGQLFLFSFFGVCIQLVLENVTVYVLAVTALVVLNDFIRRKKCSPRLLALLLGCMIGTVLMFSSSIYPKLLHSGHAIGSFRALSFQLNDGILCILQQFYQRFIYFYPANLWGNNWVLCCSACLMLLIPAFRQRPFIRAISSIFCLCFVVYFLFAHFYGPLESFFSVWNEVLTQRLNLLFFWGVLLMVFLFQWDSEGAKKTLAFLWLSVPGLVLPLIVVKMIAARYFFCSNLFLIEFSLAVLAYEYTAIRPCLSKTMTAVLCTVLAMVCIHRFVIYTEIGEGKKDRDFRIQQAIDGKITRLYFPELPHSEYLWITEAPDGSEQVGFFRRFYKIPDKVEMSNFPFDDEQESENENGDV
ncbi:MAG: hypothetical protein IKS55_01815 [Oscillospiraceae bacterium]|nr:hypothetical protein [Oscillospiraceae bacterium]